MQNSKPIRLKKWSWRLDLNQRPADYKSAALPTELRQQNGAGNGTRTRNLQLGRLSLCQLSYSRDKNFSLIDIKTKVSCLSSKLAMQYL